MTQDLDERQLSKNQSLSLHCLTFKKADSSLLPLLLKIFWSSKSCSCSSATSVQWCKPARLACSTTNYSHDISVTVNKAVKNCLARTCAVSTTGRSREPRSRPRPLTPGMRPRGRSGRRGQDCRRAAPAPPAAGHRQRPKPPSCRLWNTKPKRGLTERSSSSGQHRCDLLKASTEAQ